MKKRISAKELAGLLDIPLVTVQRWVHQGKIPCKFKDNDYYFKTSEIIDWAKTHDLKIRDQKILQKRGQEEGSTTLKEAIENGGIYYNLPGHDIFTVLNNCVDLIDFPSGTDKDTILNDLLNREEIASTGIGKGVAIPHPRAGENLNLTNPIIPVFFLDQEVDFNSVDHKPIFVIFLIFSPTTKIHLNLLSRLSFCLRDNEFLSLLQQKQQGRFILNEVAEIEKKFESW